MIYGYIRVSTDKQTVENQRFEINSYCGREAMRDGLKKQFQVPKIMKREN